MNTRQVYLIATLAFVLGTFSCHAQQTKTTTPEWPGASKFSRAAYSPSFGRLSLQFGSGVLFGVGGGVITGFAAGFAAPDAQYESLPYILNGFYLGYSAVSALGVYIVVNSDTHNPSLGDILLGHGIGSGLGLGMVAAMDTIDGYMGPAYIFALAAPVIGGIIGNKISIRQKNGRTSAFLNIKRKETAISPPSVRLTRVGNFEIPDQSYSPTVKLLNISL